MERGSSTNAPWPRTPPPNPKAANRPWWWTHQEARRCHRRLEHLFRNGQLFVFQEPELTEGGPADPTTNRLEGGINSPIKRTILQHHGLPEEHMRRACEWRCYMKGPNPDPTSLNKDAHHQPPPAPEQKSGQETGQPRHYDDTIADNTTLPQEDQTWEPGLGIRQGHIR